MTGPAASTANNFIRKWHCVVKNQHHNQDNENCKVTASFMKRLKKKCNGWYSLVVVRIV